MDSDDPPSDDAGMRPPQSGPIRYEYNVRPSPYSYKTPIPFPGLTTAQVKKLKEQFDKTQSKVDFITEICHDFMETLRLEMD